MLGFWYFACAQIQCSDHFLSLLEKFESVDQFWHEVTVDMWLRSKRYQASWQRIQQVKASQSSYLRLKDEVEGAGINIVDWQHELYPPLLKEIYQPPLVLFAKGNSALLSGYTHVSIVGTRKATAYGLSITAAITKFVIRNGMVPVSGLAYGIDSAVHEEALKAEAYSIAVVPGALTDRSLAGNALLGQKLNVDQHLFISETMPYEKLTKFHFIKRNRIIAGLSKWLFVTEAPRRSGALITAQNALDNGREIIAAPHGLFNPSGEGCLKLIQKGATIMTAWSDLADILGAPVPSMQKREFQTVLQEQIYNAVLQGCQLEDIAAQLHQPIAVILPELGYLLMRGYLSMDYSGQYLAE